MGSDLEFTHRDAAIQDLTPAPLNAETTWWKAAGSSRNGSEPVRLMTWNCATRWRCAMPRKSQSPWSNVESGSWLPQITWHGTLMPSLLQTSYKLALAFLSLG